VVFFRFKGRHLKSALKLLLLAFLLVTPGFATAAGVECLHRAPLASEADESDKTPNDCHDESGTGSALAHDDSEMSSDDAVPSCCKSGMSCATVVAIHVAPAELRHFASLRKPTDLPILAYSSQSLIPDYPPPRA
jgi:hypothetical protein